MTDSEWAAALDEITQLLEYAEGDPHHQAARLLEYFQAEWQYDYVLTQDLSQEHPVKTWFRWIVLQGRKQCIPGDIEEEPDRSPL